MKHTLAFEPNDFPLACRVRLGVPVPVPHWIRSCNCGDSLDDSGYHLITCKTGGGPVWTHDSVVSTWSDCLRSIDIHHKKEPRQRYRDSDDRPDIAVFESGLACNCDLDIAMAHPWSSDVFPQSGMKEGVAAKRREERKEAKYSKLYSSTGEKSSVVPLVF